MSDEFEIAVADRADAGAGGGHRPPHPPALLVTFGPAPQHVRIEGHPGRVLASTHPGAPITSPGRYQLRPHEGVGLEHLP